MASSGSSRSQTPADNHFAVISTQQYASGPPVSKLNNSLDDSEVYETVTEDEYVTRKKKVTQTTKNIEKRVQRQLLLEDGEVVHVTEPVVTEDATEDTVVHESQAEEGKPYNTQAALPPPGEGWVAVPGAVVVSEKLQSTVNSHQVVEDARETEEIQHCGDVTDREVQDHIDGKGDLRAICEARTKGLELAHLQPKKRIVSESLRKWGTIDTQDVRENSKIQDGHVVTETERTTQHEQYENESLPDSGSSLSDGSAHEEVRDTQHNITHTKDEDFVEYYAVPKGKTLAQGVKIGEGMHVVSEDFHEDKHGDDIDSLTERAKKNRRLLHSKTARGTQLERTDALTCKPIDYHQEEATRKFETNKWLNHHFGSESSKSRGSSVQDITEVENRNNKATSGGNIITITMSPRPATPEDTVDASPPGRLRRWGGAGPYTSTPTPQAPPMPPPKPNFFGSSMNSSFRDSEEGLDKRMVDARARLRPTGRDLNESTESNGSEVNHSSRMSNGRYGGLPERIQVLPMGPDGAFTPPMTPKSPMSPSFNSPIGTLIKDDPVYGSKFRSGTPTKLIEPESPPPPLPTTEPPNFVGRSQSFNTSSKPWQKSYSPPNYNSLSHNSKTRNTEYRKTYQSQERLDEIEHTPRKSNRFWPFAKKNSSPERRDPSPPQRLFRRLSPFKNRSPNRSPSPPKSKYSAEAGTQTKTPVPPPRHKRRNKTSSSFSTTTISSSNSSKPQKTYFFGDNNVAMSNMSNSLRSTTLNHSNLNGSSSRPYQSSTIESTTHYRQRNNSSPKIEKRYKTTKTITPVIVLDADRLRISREEESEAMKKQRSRHYRSMDQLNDDAPKSTWTSTIDPRRRPRSMLIDNQERPTTLPRKVDDSPHSKSYFFGQDDPSPSYTKRNHMNGYSGSMLNVSNKNSSTTTRENYSTLTNGHSNSISSLRNSSKPVSRSHSFNVQPESKLHNSTLNRTFTETSEEKKTSSVYRSSPYLNLRSPNLIANIARTSSIKRLNEINGYDSNSNLLRNSNLDLDSEEDDQKRKVFMKGLLTNAPELYHYLHGEDNSPSEPPRLIRPPEPNNNNESYTSPTSAKYFTFGRESRSNSTSNRGTSSNYTGSLGRDKSVISSDNKTDSSTNLTNSYRNSANRRSAFNLKQAGSSLLYSPSFRKNEDSPPPPPWERRDSNDRSSEAEDWSSKYKVTSSVQRNGPVTVQVRDWNTR